MFVPRILINMAAGHLTMKYGFQVGRKKRACKERDYLMKREKRVQTILLQPHALQGHTRLEMLCVLSNTEMLM